MATTKLQSFREDLYSRQQQLEVHACVLHCIVILDLHIRVHVCTVCMCILGVR